MGERWLLEERLDRYRPPDPLLDQREEGNGPQRIASQRASQEQQRQPSAGNGLLHLDLLGLFLEDTSLHDLASIPFSREFRPLGGGWHTIDLDRLSRDFELAARSIERKFMDAAKRLPTGYQFEVARGPMGKTFSSVSRTGDIVMIVEPPSPVERATHQFSWLLEAAFQSAADVMLVPRHIVRTKGPVAAIVTADTGLAIKRFAAASIGLADPTACALAFRQNQERLIVMTRGAFADGAASAIAAARQVPVLVVEPLGAVAGEVILRPTAAH